MLLLERELADWLEDKWEKVCYGAAEMLSGLEHFPGSVPSTNVVVHKSSVTPIPGYHVSPYDLHRHIMYMVHTYKQNSNTYK